MKVKVTVKRIDGGVFVSEYGTRKSEIDLRLYEGFTWHGEKRPLLEVGNFGWNIRAVSVVNPPLYRSRSTKRAAIARRLKTVGLTVVAWSEELDS